MGEYYALPGPVGPPKEPRTIQLKGIPQCLPDRAEAVGRHNANADEYSTGGEVFLAVGI